MSWSGGGEEEKLFLFFFVFFFSLFYRERNNETYVGMCEVSGFMGWALGSRETESMYVSAEKTCDEGRKRYIFDILLWVVKESNVEYIYIYILYTYSFK